jgi:hypothetical protein
MIAVITFYTPEYEQEATEWRKTCHEYLQIKDKVQYPFKSYAVPGKGSWVRNCTMKANIIIKALEEFNCGVVWTDADARFRQYPEIFQKFHDYDFGCYWIPDVWNQARNSHLKPWSRGNEALAGGTLYFNNTKLSKELLFAWKEESEANPERWEQQSLQKVWESFDNKGLKTFNMPQSYCKVFDCKWFEPETPVVIEHTQASRRLRGKVK